MSELRATPAARPEKTPVTVLTGFLGSGKTTLLQRMLRSPDMADTAVIINEAGEMGLDHLLVEAVDEQVLELPSGCLCCIRRLDIVTTVRDLLDRRDSGAIRFSSGSSSRPAGWPIPPRCSTRSRRMPFSAICSPSRPW